jgi:spermidine/putrescine-binding protein
MTDEVFAERRLSRDQLLKLAAATGGAGMLAGLVAGRASAAGALLDRLTKESGRLQVLDWAGYEVKPLWTQYAKQYPKELPQFTFMTNEANALAKMNAGFKPDVVRPYVGYLKDFADSGFLQPWDPKLIPNLKQLNPAMVKAGQLDGKQWGIPEDWGFDAILYRTDKVQPKARSGAQAVPAGLVSDTRCRAQAVPAGLVSDTKSCQGQAVSIVEHLVHRDPAVLG